MSVATRYDETPGFDEREKQRDVRTTTGLRARWWRARLAAALVACAVASTVSAPMSRANAVTTPTPSWTLAAASPQGHWRTVVYARGLFVALGRAPDVAVSRDGAHWTLHPVPRGPWSSVAYGNGLFIALSSSSTGPRELTSTDGVTWVARSGPAGSWTGIAFGNGRFVAVSSNGQITTTVDGVTWQTTWVHSKFDFTSIAYGNGRFIAVDAAQGDDLISLTGLGWSFYPITTAHQQWSSVTFGDGNFVAFDNSRPTQVATSVLGYTWTPHSHAWSQSVDAAAFGCGTFVAVGHALSAPSQFATSPTGAAWAPSPLPVDPLARWTAVAFGSSRFVAVDSQGRIASMRTTGDCSRATPAPPRDVSGNIPAAGQVWTYMHPPATAGAAPIDGYLITVSDGTTTRTCHAAVYYQPNCIVSGLRDHHIYYVTTQAHNRDGYSVASDPEWVIPVASWNFVAGTLRPVVSASSPVLVEVTGVQANSAGIYPESQMAIHFGDRVYYCQPSWFGECYIRVGAPALGRTAIYADYVGYGRAYRTPTSYVTVVP